MEFYNSNTPFTYGCLGYCVFFPEQNYKIKESYFGGICSSSQEKCGQSCNYSEDRIGSVTVSAWRVCDYPYEFLRREFADRGLCDMDIVAKIEQFYPVRLKELREKGIGGSVLNEVVKDCRGVGAAAIYCTTPEPEMRSMLRNRRFGFEELLPEFSGDFINVFKGKPANPKFREQEGLIVRSSDRPIND